MPGSSSTMWKRCAAILRLTQAASGPACSCSPTPRDCQSICRRRLRHFCANIPISTSMSSGAADLGFAAEHALPDNIERFLFSEDRLTLVASRRGDFAGRRQIDFTELADRDFVGLTNSTALQVHIAKHAARLGVRLRFRARLRDFDAICQLVAADVGIAVVPEAAARRCARSMPITMIKIRDPWANRKLTICARSFKTLPRPAKQLVEHLRKGAQR